MNVPPLGIGIYAPSGYVHDPTVIDRAAAYLVQRGHRVIVDPSCAARMQRFAGDDDTRLAAVMRMADDPAVELALAARGGYGWSRLLDRIDFRALASRRKRWMGHSDFTAFQLAALTHAGMVTYAGPMAAYDFGGEISAFTLDHCARVLADGKDEVEFGVDGAAFSGEGTLWGGNLAMVAHLVGTPHLPQTRGGILFVEDIGEHPYRVERMLFQLHFAGVLARQRALLLGAFNGYEKAANDNGYDMASVVALARARFGLPVIAGLPFGHVRDKLTLPVGGHCVLDVRDGRAFMRISVPGAR